MRSADEQLRLIRGRAAGLRRRRQALLTKGGSAACLMSAILLCFLLSGTGGAALPEGSAFGSLILASPLVSCIVIAVLAFVLGICVTLLCVHSREQRGEREDEDP